MNHYGRRRTSESIIGHLTPVFRSRIAAEFLLKTALPQQMQR